MTPFPHPFQKRLNGDGDDGEEESEEEESDEDDYDFDDDDEEEVDDSCPPGCDIGLYEKVSTIADYALFGCVEHIDAQTGAVLY